MISGMCASGWIPEIGETITFPAYLYRRAKRLLPLNALSVTVFSVLKLIYYFIHHEWLYNIPFDLWGMISACLGIQAGWATSNPMLNNPVWYISVLMWCYIVLYFVTWLGKKLWGGVNVYYLYASVIFAGMGIVTYGTELPFLNSYTARGYMSFFLGIVIKEIWKHVNIKRTGIQLFSWLLLAGVMISVVYGSVNMDFIVVFVLWPAVITVVVKLFCNTCG